MIVKAKVLLEVEVALHTGCVKLPDEYSMRDVADSLRIHVEHNHGKGDCVSCNEACSVETPKVMSIRPIL